MKPSMRVIDNKSAPATAANISMLEFKAVKRLRGLSSKQRIKKAHAIADSLRPMSVIALEIVVCEKAELIAKVQAGHDTFGPFLMELAHAKDNARALMEVLEAAEMRLAVALAVVEGDAG